MFGCVFQNQNLPLSGFLISLKTRNICVVEINSFSGISPHYLLKKTPFSPRGRFFLVSPANKTRSSFFNPVAQMLEYTTYDPVFCLNGFQSRFQFFASASM